MRHFVLWLGLVISSICLYLAFRGVEWVGIWATLRAASVPHLAVALGALALCFHSRALRWRVMLRPQRVLRSKEAFRYLMIGLMANNVLPARLGELARAFIVGSRKSISMSFSLATIFVEHFVDLVAVLVLLGISFVLFELPTWARWVGLVGSVILASATTLVLVAVIWGSKSLEFANRCLGFLPGTVRKSFVEKGELFLSGLRILASPAALVRIVGWTLVVWATWVLGLYCALRSLSISVPLFGLLFLTATLNLGVLVPSSPGFVGTFQYVCVTSLAVLSVERAAAAGFSVLFHALWFVPLTVMGFVCLSREGLRISEIAQQPKVESPSFPASSP